jgi:excisionase family DNA binding protein
MDRVQVPEKLVYSVVEAGRLLGLGRSASYEAARGGELPTIKIGGRYKVPKAALQRLLESAEQPGRGD